MPRLNFRWIMACLALCLFCWLIRQGSLAGPYGPMRYVKGLPGHYQDYENVGLFIDIMQHVEAQYVHELSKDERRKFVETAIQAGLHGLDEHSGFMNSREYRSFAKTTEGSFGGIGINLVVPRETKKLTIVSPIAGSPAYRAGIKPGDEIEKINGQSTQGMSSDDAVDKIQGPPGEPIVLTIRSRGSTRLRDVKLIREVIEVDSVMGDRRNAQQQWEYMIDPANRIGYIRINVFGRKTADELRQVLLKLKEQKVRGLVLDLRGNPGGSLTAAVEIVRLFVDHGRIVSVEGRTHNPEYYDAIPEMALMKDSAEHPMVVLVNEGSASASEIVAAALQDWKRATVIGERTFGKGSVQSLIQMEGGTTALKLTIAKYLRPSGKNIHRFPNSKVEDDWGVRPDMEVKLTPTEELGYWLNRRDRDIIRVPLTAEEQKELIVSISHKWAGLWTFPGPMGVSFQLYSLAQTCELIPLPANKVVDRVLEKALELLRQTQSRSGTVRAG